MGYSEQEKRFFPVSAVTKRITELLLPAISKQFWVKAEIASGRERGCAFYCDLVETDDKGQVVAKLACNIWQGELSKIRASFKKRGMDLVLVDGTVVGFCCSLQYGPQYGLSLRVIDADPAVSLGEMELKKRELIERLKKEGMFERNKVRNVPMLPLRIGLITSKGSAAYNDFIQTLTASRYGFRVFMADAMMQGDQTEKTVLRGLERLYKIGVELIVIARGGGSKTDLYFLDNEEIARKIADSAIPVWTGIGHEVDTSVLDYVANKAFKTPTAVAEDLVARFVQMRRQLDEASNTLETVWMFRLENDKTYLDRATTGIRQGSKKLLDITTSNLRERAQELKIRVIGRISKQQITLKAKEQRLRSRPVLLLRVKRERLTSERRLLESRIRSAASEARRSLNGMAQRFDRDRFIRRVAQMRRQFDEASNTLETVWMFRLENDKTYLDRAITGIRQGSKKLLDITTSNLRERAQELKIRVIGRISKQQITLKAKEQRLRSRPVLLLRVKRERLTSERRLLESRIRSAASEARRSLNGMAQRFDQDRFIRRFQIERDSRKRKNSQLKSRFLGVLKVKETQLLRLRTLFRLERIRPRIIAEQKGLTGKLATLNAASPERALERGFALTYRQDGRLVRSVNDILQCDKIRTRLADGVVFSEVISKEDKS